MRSIFGFHVTFAVDAIADMSGDAHENGLRRIFPTPGEAGATMVIGGGALLAGSLGWEANSTQSLQVFWGWPAALGWLFLLVFGSLIGYSLFMQLLRDLGPAKAGSFAFVSPIIAVLVGVISAGETVSPLSIAGMAVMLVAAGACLYSDVLEGFLARTTSGRTSVRPAL